MRSPSTCVFVAVLVGCTQSAAEGGDEGTGSDTESESETGVEPGGWTPVFQASQEIGALMSVWGSSPEDMFVVGGQPELGGGRVLHGVADEWVAESLPPDTAMLNWVYGVDGLVWSVGLGGTILRREAGVWTTEISGSDRVLWGLWGASADELWAVGGDGVAGEPLLLRREPVAEGGGDWTAVELPPLGVEAHALFKVWGTAADDVWVVGDAGATLHWDGDAWTAHPDPAGVDLISVWGSPNEGLIAVGGRASARVDRLSGQTWSGQTLALPGLNGVWVDPEAGATAVGVQGTILRILPNGPDAELVTELEDAGTTMVLHSVFGFSGGPRFAVGGSLLMPAPFVGVILRAD